MYEILQMLCKSKNISITNLCLEITGSRGNLSTWKKGNINPVSLVKIADYFDVSTDYLLGRTKNSNFCIHEETESQDSLKQEFLKAFDSLSFADKIEVINIVLEKIKKSG